MNETPLRILMYLSLKRYSLATGDWVRNQIRDGAPFLFRSTHKSCIFPSDKLIYLRQRCKRKTHQISALLIAGELQIIPI